MNDNNDGLNPDPQSIKDIPFDQLVLPPYQRPYKWKAKHVNQLITDIATFKNNAQYRLGTLVLYRNKKNNTLEIVDGQQRIVTLTLLIKILADKFLADDDSRLKQYYEITRKVYSFINETKFFNPYSLHNVVKNIHVIEERVPYLDVSVLDFIINRCEFVVITLDDISEAFQFFDSQNGRGKDLEPHDLLKAFHLREIPRMTDEDYANLDQWQNEDTGFLKTIFEVLYRAKRWSQGKSALEFTKDDTPIFKGVSIHDKKRYPFYQLEVIAHVFTQMYTHDAIRLIDQHILEYPFNLDDQIVNGGRFFDMIRHYIKLYLTIMDEKNFPEGQALEIIKLINYYKEKYRTGDQHVRKLFDTVLFYYVDRFGMEELDKVIPKFFIWAYKLRLENRAVHPSSYDKYAIAADSMIRLVHDVQTPQDIINYNIEINSHLDKDRICTKCEAIKEKFKSFNKIYHNVQYNEVNHQAATV